MTRRSDREAAKAHRAGLKRHCAEQARHRAKNKTRKRPERDDVASAALRLLLQSMVQDPDRATTWTAILARNLARSKVPFDPVETTAVVEAMIERHRNTMEEARKRRAEKGREA